MQSQTRRPVMTFVSWKRLAGTFSALVTAAACSSVEPQIGPETRACAAWTADCTVTDAGDCDDCESANCCADRLACYQDATCGCADVSLDACLENTSGSADDPAVAACWAAFVGTGTLAYRRAACQRAFCQAECSVPTSAAIMAAGADGGTPASSESDAQPAD